MKKNNFFKGLLYTFAFSIFGLGMVSCDPTIDAFEFDIDEETEDLTPPTAMFSFTEDFNQVSNTIDVSFNNLSSSANTYVWDFGNGDTSTEFEPLNPIVYENSDSGTVDYTITLTASDAFGVVSVASTTFTIGTEFVREPQPTDPYDLINTGADGDPVSVIQFSSAEDSKGNIAVNILDKDPGGATKWTANDEVTGDNMGDGEFVIFDLGAEYELGLLRFKTDLRSSNYAYQILTSTTGSTETDFSILLPEGGTTAADWQFTEAANAEYQYVELNTPTVARYVKLIVYGRYNNSDANNRDSLWNNWEEIEFWSTRE